MRNEELEVTRPTPGGGVSDLGVGIIRGPSHRNGEKGLWISKKSGEDQVEIIEFSVLFSAFKSVSFEI